jgi:photosystem II stability/assembly factor-like uncharacterized protein
MYKFLTTVSISLLLVSSAAAQTGVWKSIITPAGIAPGFTQMVFVTDTIGYIYGHTQNVPFDLERTSDTGVDFSLLTWPKVIDTFHVDTNGHKFLVFSSDKAIQSVNDMAWPSPTTGIIVGPTYADTFHASSPTVIITHDAGVTWKEYYPVDTFLQMSHICFPTTLVGYATGVLSDGTGASFIAKTLDGGQTWTELYHSSQNALGALHFLNASSGIILSQGGASNEVSIAYTTNGGSTFTFLPMTTDSTPNFLQWNTDGSWLIGIDSVYRSIDSGKHWTSVVPFDTLAGPPYVATFNNSVGFVFREFEAKVLETTDYGKTWTSSNLPLPAGGTKADTVTPVAASMPSPRVAYLLASDAYNSTDVLMKFEFPTGPKQGVSLGPQDERSFAVYADQFWLNFDASSAPEQRTIEVVDLLGRECASIAVLPNSTSSHLALRTLHAGSYFARLGSAIVKFNIWE